MSCPGLRAAMVSCRAWRLDLTARRPGACPAVPTGRTALWLMLKARGDHGYGPILSGSGLNNGCQAIMVPFRTSPKPAGQMPPRASRGRRMLVRDALPDGRGTVKRSLPRSPRARYMSPWVRFWVRSSRLGLTWADGVWLVGCPQVKRALPTLSGVQGSGSAGWLGCARCRGRAA
jgi:hypothetical protein